MTEWWIQLEDGWFKYNVLNVESINNLNPWKSWNISYIFNTDKTELWTWSILIFNKTNLKEEVKIKIK
jgi:hypothetical protein